MCCGSPQLVHNPFCFLEAVGATRCMKNILYLLKTAPIDNIIILPWTWLRQQDFSHSFLKLSRSVWIVILAVHILPFKTIPLSEQRKLGQGGDKNSPTVSQQWGSLLSVICVCTSTTSGNSSNCTGQTGHFSPLLMFL